MEISTHVSYDEVVRSNTALRKNIKNNPNLEQLERIKTLCNKVFEPLREWVEGPIKINSVFRSKSLNKAIGGSISSQHMANNGAAMDIDDIYKHKTNKEMFHYIKDNLEFDQLIYEFPDEQGNARWVHVSYNEGSNRGNIMIATKINGKTRYISYKGNEHYIENGNK